MVTPGERSVNTSPHLPPESELSSDHRLLHDKPDQLACRRLNSVI